MVTLSHRRFSMPSFRQPSMEKPSDGFPRQDVTYALMVLGVGYVWLLLWLAASVSAAADSEARALAQRLLADCSTQDRLPAGDLGSPAHGGGPRHVRRRACPASGSTSGRRTVERGSAGLRRPPSPHRRGALPLRHRFTHAAPDPGSSAILKVLLAETSGWRPVIRGSLHNCQGRCSSLG